MLNNLSGSTPVFTIASLAPGASADFTGSYVAPTNCSAVSTLTGSGRSICGVAVANAATTTCPILTTPQVLVTAVCPAAAVAPGTVLTYTGTVRNTGDITLQNIVVVSDRPAANTRVFTVAALAPGAAATFTGSYTVPINVCPVAATLTATAQNLCAGPPSPPSPAPSSPPARSLPLRPSWSRWPVRQ